MLYFVIIGVLFLISVGVFYKMDILDLYLMAVGYGVLILAAVYALWLADSVVALLLFMVGAVLIISVKVYRSKQVF